MRDDRPWGPNIDLLCFRERIYLLHSGIISTCPCDLPSTELGAISPDAPSNKGDKVGGDRVWNIALHRVLQSHIHGELIMTTLSYESGW